MDYSIFKAYDIRGIYPTQINEDGMENITRAIYTFFSRTLHKRDITIVLGHDMRLSSPNLHTIARETLQKCGAHVVDLGLVATPTVYFALKQYKHDAAIQISASHNPAEYNGIKIALRDGDAIIKIGKKSGMDDIVKSVKEDDFEEYTDGGTIEVKEHVLVEEVDQALTTIRPGDVSGLKIVADPANAMGILPLNDLFDRLDATLVKMNFELDGTFPAHQADPLQHKTLRDLQQKVKDENADLGIAIDGDADRAMFINEKGEIIPATLITTLIAAEILKDQPGARILVDIRYIRNVEDIVRKLGGEVGYTNVGHALITSQVNTEKAAFAGESSGHYYFLSMGGCESTMRIVLYVLRVLTREKRPISQILQELQTSIESGEVNFELNEGVASDKVTTKLKETYADGELNTLDGIAISYDDWRFSVRSSNTEPLVRLNVEGKTQEVVDHQKAKLTQLILDLGAHIKE
ncbi:MAG: phosphomannomutase/phosphoglucomutase [bacterium]|nr:phosphomannomutase/phosphoglucomutase [bacterium]